ncbi:hypothetical protein [uncultured Psychrobacter sp.]|uniref:hypothetical protein n=1 Tax=uncultured Psychrobacter sp. TaxID=259303 RepID=UPI00345B3300
MSNKLTGSHSTRVMLERENKPVWCAVSDNSDEEAIQDLAGNDFTFFITSYKEGYFYCTSGMQWAFAIPIEIVAVTKK